MNSKFEIRNSKFEIKEFLTAREVVKTYKNGSKEVGAVNGISLEFKKGESVAIVGPSGAGKSTLLHLLGGLDMPTKGRVILDGRDIYGMTDAERAKARNLSFGFVFQFYHLLPEFTALENVMMPGLMRGVGCRVKGEGLKERARKILKSVGLEDRMNHRPGELSGGESQRVAIARAIINEPEILFCDEPTGNLDSKTSESIYELLFGMESAVNTTIILVTHDHAAASKAKRAVHIKDGRIV